MPAHCNNEFAKSGELSHAREYFRNVIFQEILIAFSAAAMSRAELSRRLKKKPEQITRWLSSPGNLEIDTISDLLMAMNVRPSSIIRARLQSAPSASVKELLAKIVQPPAAFPNSTIGDNSSTALSVEAPAKETAINHAHHLENSVVKRSLFHAETRSAYLERHSMTARGPSNKLGSLALLLAKKHLEAA